MTVVWLFVIFSLPFALELHAADILGVPNSSYNGGIVFIIYDENESYILAGNISKSSYRTLSSNEREALRRAAEYWVAILLEGKNVAVNVGINTVNVNGAANGGAISTASLQFPMGLIQGANVEANRYHAAVEIGNITDQYYLQTNLPNAFSFESLLIHEIAHVFGLNGTQTPKPNAYYLNQSEVAGKWYFNGTVTTQVYNDYKVGGTEKMPVDNDEIGKTGVASARAHSGVWGSLMGYGYFSNYPMLLEVELAVFKDLGYDVYLRNFFGRSIYTSGNNLTNTVGFFRFDPLKNSYTSAPNTSIYGIGLHIFGDNNTVLQAADIYADGSSAAGIRIDGKGNSISTGDSTISASGDRGTALLLAFGSNHQVLVTSSIIAAGDGGTGIRLDMGRTGSSAYIKGDTYTQSISYSHFNSNPFASNSTSPYYAQFAKAIDQLKGPLASKVNVLGSIISGDGPYSAAIYIGPGAHVETINIMRPNGGTTPSVTGDIITDYDIFLRSLSSTLPETNIYFGYEADKNGDPQGSPDAFFDLLIDGKILGYDASWTNHPEASHQYIYQEQQNDTFIG
ncbi:MAG: hypothetical protein LBF22_10020, partial [Deltaproteobacteria bacterium]|nr:hypothetical protein [Deltaproteobacteria bacterium]